MPPAAGVRPIRAPRGPLSAPGWARPAGSLSACDFHGTASRAWHMIFAGPGSVDRAWHGRRGQPFRSCHGKTVLTQGAGSVRLMPRSPGRGGPRGPAALQGRLRGPDHMAARLPSRTAGRAGSGLARAENAAGAARRHTAPAGEQAWSGPGGRRRRQGSPRAAALRGGGGQARAATGIAGSGGRRLGCRGTARRADR